MLPDPDIWRAAAILIQRHGAGDAALVAGQRVDEYTEKGDGEGQEIWKAIVEAVLELMRGAPQGGERVN
jgi:hypothetical protein